MRISIIVAMDLERGIGRNGTIPWKLPRDMKRFRDVTMGRPIIMGRRTHESIGRALPGRENIVLSREPAYLAAPGCIQVVTMRHAIDYCRASKHDEVVVVGGEEVYRAALPLAETIYLTVVMALYPADTHFPKQWVDGPAWTVTTEEQLPATGASPACAFLRCERSLVVPA